MLYLCAQIRFVRMYARTREAAKIVELFDF